MEELQSHICGGASGYMTKCANISPYMRRPLVIYDWASAPFLNFPICVRENSIFFFISVTPGTVSVSSSVCLIGGHLTDGGGRGVGGGGVGGWGVGGGVGEGEGEGVSFHLFSSSIVILPELRHPSPSSPLHLWSHSSTKPLPIWL
jgi:hypothetical protein